MNGAPLLLLLLGFSVGTLQAWGQPTSGSDEFCVVIDPGHGGRESGSIGMGGLKEKTVTLNIAQRLGELVSARSGARVVLTRVGDYYVSLDERAKNANRAKDGAPADLCISIHLNACMERTVNGFQVFYASKRHELGLDEIIHMGETRAERTKLSTEPREDREAARWDSQYFKHREASKVLAASVAETLEKRLTARRLPTAPAVLRLVRGLDMPAVLVEVGFISNGPSEAMFGTEEFQEKCAQGLLEGILAYQAEMRLRLFR